MSPRGLALAIAAAAALAGCGAPAEDDPDDATAQDELDDTGDDAPPSETSVPDDRTPVPDDRTPVPDDRTPVPDDRTPVPDDRSDVPGDRSDVPGDRSDVPGDVRDASLDVRDAAADVRDAAADVRDAAADVRDAGLDAPRMDGGTVCPPEMVLVEGRVCVDRWEAALEEVGMDGGVTPWSPYYNPGTRQVRAVSRGGVVPQGYIAGTQAQTACVNAGKRLCALSEWMAACRGPTLRTYPYGNTYVARRCNEGRTPHPVIEFFGTSMGVFTSTNMNNPGINMQANTVAPTGMFWDCVSTVGAYDMVGNMHEWIDDSAGTFKGGFYVDAEINGHGCLYTTTAHNFSYRDYSTGFRCCANPR